MSLVRAGVTSRAKIIATGRSPFSQNRQCFLPVFSPLTFSGWNGPGTLAPSCGPDLTPAAVARPVMARAATTAVNRRCVFMDALSLIEAGHGSRSPRNNEVPYGSRVRESISEGLGGNTNSHAVQAKC